jgi:acetoacetyl-CoA synthetase
LLTADRHRYAGKDIDITDKTRAVAQGLEPLGLQHVVVVGQLSNTREPSQDWQKNNSSRITWHTWTRLCRPRQEPPPEIPFWRGPAMAPVWVLFSSGIEIFPFLIIFVTGDGADF